MEKKVEEDFIRQLAKSIFNTYGAEKTSELIKELEYLISKDPKKS
jgi:hypothetical protein